MEEKTLLTHENAERILQEGWDLFQQKGFRGVSIDELCHRCGVSKPTLYYYFSDKENLFVQVLQYRLRGFHQVIEQPGSVEQRLERVAGNIFEHFQGEYNILLRDRAHIQQPGNLQKIRSAFHDELFNPLNRLMQTGIESGELVSGKPETFTLIFLGIVNNFIGKAADMDMDHLTLAQYLTQCFLNGAKQR